MAEEKKYRVVTRIRHDGVDYEPGDTIELSANDAKAMPHAIERIKEKPAEKEK